MHIQEIWRYPVKSMRGERLAYADIEMTGIRGDRNIVVVSASRDRIITARTHPALLSLRATFSAEKDTLIEGHLWHSMEALELVCNAAGEQVKIVDAGHNLERFDILPLLVATDGAIAELRLDLRRLRPNIVISGVAGLAERTWPGHYLQSDNVRIAVAQLRTRCVMTTFDPDTQVQDAGVLRRIVKEAGGKLALDCSVESPGLLRVGDPIELLPNP